MAIQKYLSKNTLKNRLATLKRTKQKGIKYNYKTNKKQLINKFEFIYQKWKKRFQSHFYWL
ncbi:hypothetical protein CWN98_00100 [Vibrio splendidus]|nr:hypothetical protein BCU95_23850 [Vibrio splendidus]PMI74076.1 hypothetical protein BCU38_16090 [Vibrio splendidus]PMN83548.1 hypothetical protein BCT24_11980 [Vibrio splendidus]PMO02948.1 hypothetical protein BCT19_03635 [Vibrio splendidus]PTO90964.1 hypothetical protein CWN98_00100 [Vibrio splendidus]